MIFGVRPEIRVFGAKAKKKATTEEVALGGPVHLETRESSPFLDFAFFTGFLDGSPNTNWGLQRCQWGPENEGILLANLRVLWKDTSCPASLNWRKAWETL